MPCQGVIRIRIFLVLLAFLRQDESKACRDISMGWLSVVSRQLQRMPDVAVIFERILKVARMDSETR